MRIRVVAPLAILALVAAACSTGTGAQPVGPAEAPYNEGQSSVKAQAGLKDAKGNTVGFAEFTETRAGIQVRVSVFNLPPGKKGVHIHAVGKCEPGKDGAPDFASAGAHFNPIAERKHGLKNAQGPHAGDLPNLEIGKDGKGELLTFNPNVSVVPSAVAAAQPGSGNSILQKAFVIHEKEDDETTDPTGNSGNRIACGVIARVAP